MSGPSRRRSHAKYAAKQQGTALLRSGRCSDRFTFMKTLSQMMDEYDGGKYRNADERTQLAIYDVIWNLSQRLVKRSPC